MEAWQGGRQARVARATAGAACREVARCAREFKSAPDISRPCMRARGQLSSNMDQQHQVEASGQA